MASYGIIWPFYWRTLVGHGPSWPDMTQNRMARVSHFKFQIHDFISMFDPDWLVGLLACCSVNWLAGWLARWLAWWLVGPTTEFDCFPQLPPSPHPTQPIWVPETILQGTMRAKKVMFLAPMELAVSFRARNIGILSFWSPN